MLQEELNIVNFILFKFTNKAPIDSFIFKRLPLTMQELVLVPMKKHTRTHTHNGCHL